MENITQEDKKVWSGLIQSYHDGRIYYKCDRNETKTIGIELETAQQDKYNISCAGWKCQEDSSINGLEFVSPVYTINDKQNLFNDLNELITNIKPYVYTDVSQDTASGLHIHISKNYLKNNNKMRLLQKFIQQNYIFLMMISGRKFYNYYLEKK